MPTKISYISRIMDRLVKESRRSRLITRHALSGGAELAVLVDLGSITLTVKRQNQPLGERELLTFRRDCGVPDDAEVLTPPDQGTRFVPVLGPLADGSMEVQDELWRYVTYRWKDQP